MMKRANARSGSGGAPQRRQRGRVLGGERLRANREAASPWTAGWGRFSRCDLILARGLTELARWWR